MSEPRSPQDIISVFSDRQRYYQSVHDEMSELLAIKEFGTLPSKFDDYFPPDSHVHIINNIALAWDDTAARTAKVMMPYVAPSRRKGQKESEAKKQAEKVEQIALGYNDAGLSCGKPSMRTLMNLWASDLVGLGDAVGMVLPNYDYKTPIFVHRDPRSHYPPIGWAPHRDSHLDNTLFAYIDTLSNLKLRYPDKADELDRAYSKTYISAASGGAAVRDPSTMPLWVGEYLCEDAWYFCVLEGKGVVLMASEQGDKGHPGVCPVWAFTRPSLTRSKGRSLYADQVSLMAALARMVSQKIDYYDKTLYARTFISEPVGGEIEEGPGGTTVLKSLGGEKPFVQQLAPANPVDADQMIAMIEGLARVLNRNPEQFQGSGPADSAKALSQLEAGINSTIQDGIWPLFTEGLPKLYSAAAKMDMNIWGNMEKQAQGRQRNTPYTVDYTPNVDLRGYENAIRIEVGIGLGGYHGVLELLQRYAAGTVSLDTLLEQLPDVMEPAAEKRRIQEGELEKLMFAAFASKAEQGIINPAGIAKIRKLVTAEDMDLFDAIEKVQNEGGLDQAPPPPEQPLPGGPGMPGGIPEDKLALLQGIPSVDAMRR